MKTPEWVNKDEASEQLSQLYDRGHSMLDLDPELKHHLNAFLDETESFIAAIQGDKSANRLVEALARLSQHGKDLGLTGVRVAIGQQEALREARRELWQDVLGWLLPRLVRAAGMFQITRMLTFYSSGSSRTTASFRLQLVRP